MNFFMNDPVVGPLAATLGLGGFAFSLLFIVITLWTLLWKALALWNAARNRQKIWFIVFLFIHTLGILEIVYLKWFAKDSNSEGTGALFPFLAKVRVPKMASSRTNTK